MIRLGVTGHRPNRLHIDEARLAARVKAVLSALIKAAGDAAASHPIIEVVSPLAEGADRIVAREGLLLGQRLTALLPIASADYEATFADEASRRAFRDLLAASTAQHYCDGQLRRLHEAYAAAGKATVARSDLILTIWDGKPAEGPGGTTDVLQAALDANVPVIWIDAARDRDPLLLRVEPRDQAAACVALAVVARGAKPLTDTACRALVSAALAGSGR